MIGDVLVHGESPMQGKQSARGRGLCVSGEGDAACSVKSNGRAGRW